MRKLLAVAGLVVSSFAVVTIAGLVLYGDVDLDPPAEATPARRAPILDASKGTVRSALRRPTAKPCLAPPSTEGIDDDHAYLSSQGLSYEQIRGSMNDFIGQTLSCIPADTTPSGTVQTEIAVACSGVVSHVEILDDGGLPPEMIACVEEMLYFAPFPAHDLPDGEVFGYPLTYRF